MFDVALTVDACLRAGTDVSVVWAVDVDGLDDWDRSGAAALTPGGGRIGSVLSGLLDPQLAGLRTSRGRLVTLTMSDAEAHAAGRASGIEARCLVSPAGDLPPDLWPRLLAREPLCLVTELHDGLVQSHELYTPDSVAQAGPTAAELMERGESAVAATLDQVVSVWCPVPRLLIAGQGPMAEAIALAAQPLGWNVEVVRDGGTATALVATLSRIDSLVVASHDIDVAGPVLAAAVGSEVGYLGALGSTSMRELRADWLRARGVEDQSSIRTPAGLPIGASAPAEVAIAVLAEAIAVTREQPLPETGTS